MTLSTAADPTRARVHEPDPSASATAPANPRRRLDLLKIPALKWFVTRHWFQFSLVFPTLVIFYFFLIAGFLGSPVGNRNIIIIFVWILWWFILITFLVPFGSRVWCAVCPFPFFGEWFQRRALIRSRVGKPGVGLNRMWGLRKHWPKALSNIWLQNFGFLALCTFSVILLTRPIVSALVFCGIVACATILHFIYRQRAFCSYLCPVSGFQGLYSMTSMTALRPRDRMICNRIKPGLDYSFEHGIAPCRLACPAGVDASGYIALIAEGKHKEALRLILDAMPFPGTCGRICHHPCEDQCLRNQIDEPVSICRLKRFVADNQDFSELLDPALPPHGNGKKIAVIGGGPCGLTCAYFLVRQGYDVTVFESKPVAGGMLRLTIPEYRLPAQVVDKDVGFIRASGVRILTGVAVGRDISIDRLRRDYQAIFVAVGAPKPRRLGIEGENLPGVLNAIDVLEHAKNNVPLHLGPKVVVIGGGNTAVDAARIALRSGAREVRILYRRTRELMPAIKHEILYAEAEGVRINELCAPVRILAGDDHVKLLVCLRMELTERDASGRPKPVPVRGSEHIIAADTILIATGQYADTEFLPGDLKRREDGTISVMQDSVLTNVPGLLAGGDVVTGPSMFIGAIAAGRMAAIDIDRYLRGEKPEPISLHPTDRAVEEMPLGIVEKSRRSEPELRLYPDTLEHGVVEVEKAFSAPVAVEEAERCLACGICGECYRGNERGWACPWFQRMGSMTRNNYCGLCMECVKSCPHDNIGLFVRPFATDRKIGGLDESWKAFIMLALASVYSVAFLGPWGTVKDWANVSEVGNWKGFLVYAGIIWTLALVGIPSLWALAAWLGKRLSGTDRVPAKELFLKYSYMLVIMGLLVWIAFSFPLIMINGAYILSTISDPLGWGWDLFGTAHIPWTPVLPEYTVFVQIPLLLFGLAFALKRGYDIALTLYPEKDRALRSLVPAGVLCTAMTIILLRLFIG